MASGSDTLHCQLTAARMKGSQLTSAQSQPRWRHAPAQLAVMALHGECENHAAHLLIRPASQESRPGKMPRPPRNECQIHRSGKDVDLYHVNFTLETLTVGSRSKLIHTGLIYKAVYERQDPFASALWLFQRESRLEETVVPHEPRVPGSLMWRCREIGLKGVGDIVRIAICISRNKLTSWQ